MARQARDGLVSPSYSYKLGISGISLWEEFAYTEASHEPQAQMAY